MTTHRDYRGENDEIFGHGFRKVLDNCHAPENLLFGAIRLFSLANLRYLPGPTIGDVPPLGFRPIFVFLVAEIEVSASARPDTVGEEEVYVVNFES